MIIRNALVFRGIRGFIPDTIYIDHGHFVSSESETSDKTVVDASGLRAIPGLVDIHSHGAIGCDFSDADPNGLRKILRYEKSRGITTYCPTTMTLPQDTILGIFQSASSIFDSPDLASIGGFNMEGPFIDPVKKGAHDAAYLRAPDATFFEQCMIASGNRIRLVTLAPNLPGATSFIRKYSGRVHISLGHTTANYSCCLRAFQSGADHVTHLYNAMPDPEHRSPGLVGAAFDCFHVFVELICDGIHIDPSVVRMTFQMFGADRIALISDSMRATGMPNGDYTLGGQKVHMENRLATLSDGTIAGSATDLFGCLQQAIRMGISETDAILSATLTPARAIGLDSQIGSIEPGKLANVILVNKSGMIIRVINRGI